MIMILTLSFPPPLLLSFALLTISYDVKGHSSSFALGTLRKVFPFLVHLQSSPSLQKSQKYVSAIDQGQDSSHR